MEPFALRTRAMRTDSSDFAGVRKIFCRKGRRIWDG